MPVLCAPALWNALRRHAESRRGHEACGFLLGRRSGDGWEALSYRPVLNRATRPARGFRIDPVDLLCADAEARAAGLTLLGVFHSHPSGDPRPSREDLADPWPTPTTWIAAGSGAGFRVEVWRRDPGGAPIEVPLITSVPDRDR